MGSAPPFTRTAPVTPEHAVEYLETLSRRHGLGELTQQERASIIADLHRHPDTIHRFIHEAEERIERTAPKGTA
jgi:hypothetical protein